ncbi:hypothetical protein NST63_26815 [Heyndrickxia sp. FSL W8-0496]|uniref:hypothetical protein n=1 Tax=Heyndrickxia TaxID=2837504 RepID=UPI0030FB3CA9
MLLTAIITISAGLVAIIGGFLVSRLIALSSERNSIQGKISEYQQEIKRINEKIDEQNKELYKIDLKWFSQKAFSNNDFHIPPLSELVKDEFINIGKRTEEELKPIYEDIVKRRGDFLEGARAPKMDSKVKDVLSNIKLSDLNLPFTIPIKTEEELEKEKKQKRATERNNYHTSRKQHLDVIKELEKEKKYWDEKIEDNQLLLKHVGKPRGIVGGIVFIVMSIIFGIVTPICYLPMKSGDMTESLRYVFLGGLFVILLYFIIYLVVLAADTDQ